MNQSQKDSDSRNMMDIDQPSGSETNVPDVVVEHIENLDQISIPEKEEEHIKSLAEVLFSDEMQEEEEQSRSKASQKAQSDQISFKKAALMPKEPQDKAPGGNKHQQSGKTSQDAKEKKDASQAKGGP